MKIFTSLMEYLKFNFTYDRGIVPVINLYILYPTLFTNCDTSRKIAQKKAKK